MKKGVEMLINMKCIGDSLFASTMTEFLAHNTESSRLHVRLVAHLSHSPYTMSLNAPHCIPSSTFSLLLFLSSSLLPHPLFSPLQTEQTNPSPSPFPLVSQLLLFQLNDLSSLSLCIKQQLLLAVPGSLLLLALLCESL